MNQFITDTTDRLKEIDELLGFTTFGKDRLDDLSAQTRQLDEEFKMTTSRLDIANLIKKIALELATLRTTQTSILEWEERAFQHKQMIEEAIARIESSKEPIKRDIRRLDNNIKHLLKVIQAQKRLLDTSKLQLEHLQEKVNQRYIRLLSEQKKNLNSQDDE